MRAGGRRQSVSSTFWAPIHRPAAPRASGGDAEHRRGRRDRRSFPLHRKRLLRGIDKVVDAVASTVGPRGRNVVLEQAFGVPQVINDGVSIARAIELEDPVENAGAQLVKEVAGRTNDAAGDGTTTASILARAMARAGVQAVASGANAMVVKRGIEKACNHVVAKLKEMAKPVRGRDDIRNVASISAGNDDVVGQMIADALDKVRARRPCVCGCVCSHRATHMRGFHARPCAPLAGGRRRRAFDRDEQLVRDDDRGPGGHGD